MFDVGNVEKETITGSTPVRFRRGDRGRGIQGDYSFADGTTGHIYFNPAKPGHSDMFSTFHRATIPERLNVYTDFDDDCYYTAHFNSWIHRQPITIDATCYQKEIDSTESQRWKFVKKLKFVFGTVNCVCFGSSLKLARERVCFILQNHLDQSVVQTEMEMVCYLEKSWLSECASTNYQEMVDYIASTWENVSLSRSLKCQMDTVSPKESMQGETTQASDKVNNTIITRDEALTVAQPIEVVPLNRFSSSEPTASFDMAVNRWIPLKPISVSTTMQLNTIISAYYLPESLYDEITDTINLMPFENYIYSDLTTSMKFVVNANKFQCGKVICSLKFDSSYAEQSFTSVQAALCRPHVILDLATNNEGELNIPFRFHRTQIRNVQNVGNMAIRPAKYATVLVQVLSQLRTGTDNAATLSLRPFITFKEANFAATSYRVATQMDTITNVVDAIAPNPALHAILKGVEHLLTNPGKGRNRDKPTDLNSQIIVPHPTRSFGHGKGPMNVVPLRMDPTAMTSVQYVKPFEDDPISTLQIAQIWGMRASFQWKASQNENEEIFSISLDPTRREKDLNSSAFTPLEQMCSLYQFWTGTYELRFDFVSNAFHTGALMFSIEFGRPIDSDQAQMPKVASNYTKTFHLGEQKSVTLRVPYIYDTLWRRSNTLPFAPLRQNRTDAGGNFSLGVEQRVATRLSCRVVNKLLPTQTVSQVIDVLVFMRASPNFRLHSLKQAGLVDPNALSTRQQFPRDYTVSTTLATDHNRYNEILRSKIPTKVVTQMDSGEKEDLDPTAQFNLGLDAGETQTNDRQTNIKDIIRRPLMIISNGQVRKQDTMVNDIGSNSAYFIPIAAPTRMFLASNFSGILDTVINTPQSRLLSLFRFYRGSIRYTILVHDTLASPVFVTHVPHTGIQIMGNALMCNTNTPSYSDPIFASGLHTEIIVPSINPMMTFEVPFDTENNWVCTNVDEPNLNYPWRDKGDTNAGHLAISSNEDRNLSVWWSAGDDFELSNFYGVDEMNSRFAIMPTDNNPTITTQADVDFQHNEIGDSRPNFTEHNTEVMDIKVPKDMISDFKETTLHARQFIDDIRGSLLPKAESIFDTLKGIITPMLPTEDTSLKLTVIYEVLWNLATALVTRNWVAVGMSMFRSLCEMLNIRDCISLVVKYATHFGQAMHIISGPATQADVTSAQSTIIGVLVGFVGQAFRVSLDRKKYDSLFSNLSDKATSPKTWSYLNQCLTYIQRIYGVLADLVSDAIGKMDPEVSALRMLCDNNTAIAKFADDVNQMTTSVNYQMFKDPTFRLKYWRTYMQAIQIQRLLATAPQSYAKPGLAKLCIDMKKHADENTANLMSHPCRPEPICIQVSGSAGIGKSHLSNALLGRLAENVNPELYRGGLSYTRNPASKWWNGFRGEFGIIYDDFCNLNSSEHIVTQLGELFALKTRQDFIPEMAAVEKKEIFAAPLVLLLLSNQDFPACVSNVAFTEEAVFRRRDILIRAELKPEYKGIDLKSLPTTVSENYEHLWFYIHNNPRHKDAGYNTQQLSWDKLLELLNNKFVEHLEFEKKEVRKRLHAIRSHVGGIDIGEIDLLDPFSIFYSLDTIEQSKSASWVPSEALQKSVDDLSKIVGTITRQPMTQSDEMDFLEEIHTCASCAKVSEVAHECDNNHKLCSACVIEEEDTIICVLCRSQNRLPRSKFMQWFKSFIHDTASFIQLVLKGGKEFVCKIISKIRAAIASYKVKTESDATYNPLHLEFDPVSVMNLTKISKSSLPSCYHQNIIDNLSDVTYYEGDEPCWRVLIESKGVSAFLNVPVNACCEDCPLTDYTAYATLVKEYIALNRNALFANLLAYYNSSNDNKELLLKRLPIFIRPKQDVADKKHWYDYLAGAFKKYKRVIMVMLKIGACCAAVAGLLGLILGEQRNEIPNSEAQAYEAGSLARLKRTIQVSRTKRERIVRAQSDISDAVESKIMHNYVIMRLWEGEKERASLLMAGIYAHQAILPKHSLRAIARAVATKWKITIEPALYSIDKSNHMRSSYTYDPKDFRVINDTDVACMQLPSSYPLFKDIRKFFCTEAEAQQHLPREAYLVLGPTRTRQLIHVKDVDITGVQKSITSMDPEGESFIIDLAIAYDHSEKGACGSLLLLENRVRPIYAMHVAGEGNSGYGLQLTQEVLELVVRSEVVTQLEDPNLEPIGSEEQCFLLSPEARVMYLGLTPKHLKPFIPNSSDIIPSLIHKRGDFQVYKEPAILAPTDPRYKVLNLPRPPLWYGCNKHGIQTTDYKTSTLDDIFKILWTTQFESMLPVVSQPKRFSPEEAVVGIPGMEFYEPIKLNTSAGYPWQRIGKNTLKDSWIIPQRDAQDQVVGCQIHRDLLKEIERKEELRKQGIQPITIFTDTLKDETRKIEKVTTPGGTRVFCASPVDYTIAQRQNLLHFCAAVMKTRLRIHCAVGINAKGTEWSSLVDYLAEVGLNNISTFDYSDFGPALNAQVASRVIKIMVAWSKKYVQNIDEKELTALLYECINSVHCAAGTVYQQFSGSPSGASITTIINSLINIFYIYVAWSELCGSLNKWELFERHVRFVVYGDDLIMSVSDQFKEIFNAATLSKFFGANKIVATDATKGSMVVPYTDIFSASFLKRGFAMHPNGKNWLAPLDWKSINDTTQWVRKSTSRESATLQNCEAALMESHAHGRAKFIQFRDQINRALGEAKIRQKLLMTWEDIDSLWFQKGEWPSLITSRFDPLRYSVDFLPKFVIDARRPTLTTKS